MAEERTVVEVELGVECHDIVIFGDDERVDLREAAVLADKGPVEVHHELRDLANSIVREVHPVGHAARLERQQTDGRVDVLLEDLVRHLSGDLLDLHAALLRAHHDDARRLAVDDERKIVFLLDGRSGLDEQAVDALAGRARLMRDEDLAEEFLRRFLDGFKRVDDLDAARLAAAPAWICALTTTTSVPSSLAFSTASSTENAGLPAGTLTPYERRIALLWYS